MTETDALTRLTSFCASAEHCEAEVMEKMRRWGLAPEAIGRIMARLVEEKYIDEERYCRAFIRDKYRFDKWGKMKIAQALQLKKIPQHVFGPLMAEIDQEEYLGNLRSLLAAKKRSVHAPSDFELNAKLVRFAMGRGFGMEDIRRCLDLPDDFDSPEEENPSEE